MNKTSYRIHFKQGEFELDVEGDQGFVESYVAAFLSNAPEGEAHKAPAPGGKKAKPSKPGRQAATAKTPGAFTADAVELKAFLKGKKAPSNKDRYLLYMGFLKSKGFSTVSNQMVQACFEAQGRTIPESGRQNFSILRREGLANEGSKRGLWNLTPEGEAKVAAGGAPKMPRKKAKPARRPAKKTARKPVAEKAVSKKAKSAGPAPKVRAAKKSPLKKRPAKKPTTARPKPKKVKALPKKVKAEKTKAVAAQVPEATSPQDAKKD